MEEIIERLRSLGSEENVAGLARYGVVTKEVFGVSAPQLKQLAGEIRKTAKDRHLLASELWNTGIHDARAIAYLIDDPKLVTEPQMDAWARDFDNWAIVDGTCGHLFCRSPLAYKKVREWSARNEEFIKRAGIVLIAWLAVHDKSADDEKIAELLPILEENAGDGRKFVKKAVNWSLRQIGKRSQFLNGKAIESAESIMSQITAPARWIASDALRELKSEAVRVRLQARSKKREEKRTEK